MTGFLAYTIYNINGYNDVDIGTGPVFFSDVLFSTHALMITFLTIIQAFIYYDKNDITQKVSTTCKNIVMCIWLVLSFSSSIFLLELIVGIRAIYT